MGNAHVSTPFPPRSREFKDKAAAGQLRRSPHHFSSVGGTSPLLLLTQGWAVLDGPTMPVVAEGDAEPNDTFIEQLVASARAAVQVPPGPCRGGGPGE